MHVSEVSPEGDVCHECNVAVGVDGDTIAGNDSAAVNICVHHNAQVRLAPARAHAPQLMK